MDFSTENLTALPFGKWDDGKNATRMDRGYNGTKRCQTRLASFDVSRRRGNANLRTLISQLQTNYEKYFPTLLSWSSARLPDFHILRILNLQQSEPILYT